MADPVAKQIVDRLQARLASIVGDGGATYHFTPGAVIEYPEFNGNCVEEGIEGPIYVISPGEKQKRPFTYGRVGVEWPLDLSLVLRFTPGTEDPFEPPDPNRHEVQEQMAKDVETAINTYRTLGDLPGVIDVQVEADEMGGETWVDGWAVVFMPVRVLYTYAEATP